jgi:uncharacterized integral membrane protein
MKTVEILLLIYMFGVVIFMFATIHRENRLEKRIKKLEDKNG